MHTSPLWLLVLAACSEAGLTPLGEVEPIADTGSAADTGTDTVEQLDTAVATCATLTIEWTPPVGGDLVLSGEFRTANGAVSVSWTDWERATGPHVAHTWDGLCGAFAFRGSGSADMDGDGVNDSWTCVNQADDRDVLIGDLTATLDGVSLPIAMSPNVDNEGCGFLVVSGAD